MDEKIYEVLLEIKKELQTIRSSLEDKNYTFSRKDGKVVRGEHQGQPKQDVVTNYAKDAMVKYKADEIKKVFDYIAYPEKHISKKEVLTILQFRQLRRGD